MDAQVLKCSGAFSVVSKLSKGPWFLWVLPLSSLVFYFLPATCPATRQINLFLSVNIFKAFSIRNGFISLVCWGPVFHTEIITYTKDGKRKPWESPATVHQLR